MIHTKTWLEQQLDYSRRRLNDALSLPTQLSPETKLVFQLRSAFAAGACLLYSAQRVPTLNAPVPDEREPIPERPDLTEAHQVLELGPCMLPTTQKFQRWDDWESYVEHDMPPPLTLDQATRWAQEVQRAFAERYGLANEKS